MSITALPTPPTREDPLNFADRADIFLGALPTFATEANALVTDVNNKQIAAAVSAANSASSAAASLSSSAVAAAAANFKGDWSALTGALAVPASVIYNNSIYLLKSNIADVTANTPGVSTVWAFQGVYSSIEISTDTTVEAFYSYKVKANCTVTLPASPQTGQWIEFLNATGDSNFFISRNYNNIQGIADGLNVDIKNKKFILLYNSVGSTWDIFG